MSAGRRSGDLVHPMVYCPELHFGEFASAVADMKNSSAVSTFVGEVLEEIQLFCNSCSFL